MKFQIENYENMTPEEKLAALEAYEPDMSGYVAKSVFDKTASDLAAAKKSLKERMTEEEAKATKEAEEKALLLAQLEELQREKMVGKYTNSYLAMGYDEKLAKSSAEALEKGDMDVVFANQKTFTENREKLLRTEKVQQTPAPEGGAKSEAMTLEKFRAMTPNERHEFSVKNPEEYKNLYGGN